MALAVVMDPFSQLVVGWAATPTIHRELVLNTTLKAVRLGVEKSQRGELIQQGAIERYLRGRIPRLQAVAMRSCVIDPRLLVVRFDKE